MMDWLRKLLGGSEPQASGDIPKTPSEAAPAQRRRTPYSELPRLGEAQKDEIYAYFAGKNRPAVGLLPDPAAPVRTGGSRLGGPVWLPSGHEWPLGANGRPMHFLAQVDFAEFTPPDPAFPDKGLLQVFIGRSDVYGINFDDMRQGDFALLFHEGIASGSLHQQPPESYEGEEFDYTPFSGDIRAKGMVLKPHAYSDILTPSEWTAEVFLEKFYGHNLEDMDGWFDDLYERRTLYHHVGGYPAFTQADPRRDERYSDYDVVLLQLTTDEHMMWGDSGEATFFIRRADLEARDFSQVLYTWDCC